MKSNPNTELLSNCCNAPIKIYTAEEGTSCWTCIKCGRGTDPKPNTKQCKADDKNFTECCCHVGCHVKCTSCIHCSTTSVDNKELVCDPDCNEHYPKADPSKEDNQWEERLQYRFHPSIHQMGTEKVELAIDQFEAVRDFIRKEIQLAHKQVIEEVLELIKAYETPKHKAQLWIVELVKDGIYAAVESLKEKIK